MAAIRDERGTPRAVIHKRILDVASERPDAAMSDIADAVGGASVDLVERVLEEYGDPGELEDVEEAVEQEMAGDDDGTTATDDAGGAGGPAAADGEEPSAADATPADDAEGDDEELTAKQREVLEAVYARPDASQRELGERLGVSASTVNSRLADVEGFAWDDRWRFVRDRFAEATDGGVAAAETEALRDRVASLESRVEELAAAGASAGDGEPSLPPALAHKVAHACLSSDRLDEEEELAVLRALMGD